MRIGDRIDEFPGLMKQELYFHEHLSAAERADLSVKRYWAMPDMGAQRITLHQELSALAETASGEALPL